jgi:hypothetical protein
MGVEEQQCAMAQVRNYGCIKKWGQECTNMLVIVQQIWCERLSFKPGRPDGFGSYSPKLKAAEVYVLMRACTNAQAYIHTRSYYLGMQAVYYINLNFGAPRCLE